MQKLKFKALKHKTLEGIFGYIFEDEIAHTEIPKLHPMTATMDLIKHLNEGQLFFIKQLEDYDLVEIEVIIP